jgi:hypothetical protein
MRMEIQATKVSKYTIGLEVIMEKLNKNRIILEIFLCIFFLFMSINTNADDDSKYPDNKVSIDEMDTKPTSEILNEDDEIESEDSVESPSEIFDPEELMQEE